MGAEYYFAIDNAQVGPLNEEEIKEHISQGKIELDTPIWAEGMSDWQKVCDTAEFLSSFPILEQKTTSPPPLDIPTAGPPPLPIQSPSKEINQRNLATFPERFLAGLIDNLILWIPSMIVSALIGSGIGAIGVLIGYLMYFMSNQRGGQTIGYRIMNLRLVDQSSGQLVPVGRAALLGTVFSFLAIIGWIWYFTDNDRRMLHNIASKTVVIKTSK